MSRSRWRLIDTGVLRAAENFAFNRALMESRKGASPSGTGTLRFVQFEPSALLGYHQSADQELNLDYCAASGIAVQRRITGGGALYMDPNQFGWELYLHKSQLGSADMGAIARRICEAAARGLSELGVDARFRPRNDIEVDGRKISGTGGAFDGDALLYQGTVLVDFDVERMLRVLRVPVEKIADKAIADARERVVTLKALLGVTPDQTAVKTAIADAFAAEFGVEFAPGELSAEERREYAAALAEIDTPEWVDLVVKPKSDLPIREALMKFPGGLLRVAVAYDQAQARIKQTWFTGDFFIQPRRAVADLEAALKDLAADRLEDTVAAFFAGRAVDMLSLAPADFSTVLRQALAGDGS